MKRFIAFGCGVLLVFGVSALPATGLQGGANPLANSHYPLAVGTTWEYQSAGKKVVVKVAAIDKIGDMTCARIETDSGANKITEHLTVKTDGVYRVRANNQDIKPPLLILKLPPVKGDSWAVDSSAQNFAMKGKLTLGEEQLQVGGKQYDAVAVKSNEMVMGGQNVEMETWFAKDIGIVKQRFKLAGADLDVVLELEKFTPK